MYVCMYVYVYVYVGNAVNTRLLSKEGVTQGTHFL